MPDAPPEDRPSAGRFYVDTLPGEVEAVELPPGEARHAASSRRIRSGEYVTLFDGSGWDLKCRVIDAAKRRLLLKGVSRLYVGHPLVAAVTIATALPKGSREDILVSMCAQMGVRRLVPVEFERSVPNVHRNWPKKAERFGRLAVEAAKQSGASTVMEISEPVAFERFLASPRGDSSVVCLPEARQGVISALEAAWPFENATFLVGPEGGLSQAEQDLTLAAGFTPVRLGASVLRIETAATAVASIVAAFVTGKG